MSDKIETIEEYLVDITLETGHTIKTIYNFNLNRVIKSLKKSIDDSTLYPITKKKINIIIDKHFNVSMNEKTAPSNKTKDYLEEMKSLKRDLEHASTIIDDFIVLKEGK